MEDVDLVALVVSVVAIVACAWVAVKLLVPFAEALAERLRPKPLATDDSLRRELDALRVRVAELEHREPMRELTAGSIPTTPTEEG